MGHKNCTVLLLQQLSLLSTNFHIFWPAHTAGKLQLEDVS